MSNLDISRAERLDQRIISIAPELSRAYAVKLIEQGRATVNGTVVTKAGHKLRTGDDVHLVYDREAMAVIPKISLPVLYEDNDCVVINKPIGVLTHSKGVFNPEATVASWLHDRVADMSGERAGIVHRLDRATSGVMICAKNPEALKWLQKQFSQRKVKKTYRAVISGALAQDHAIIDMPIERNPKHPQTFRVGPNGKPAVTEYELIEAGEQRSLLELRPTTGRTHQLRVHLSNLGHPIIGDTLYDGQMADRLYLHALSLEITLPSRERAVFDAPMPKDFKKALETDG